MQERSGDRPALRGRAGRDPGGRRGAVRPPAEATAEAMIARVEDDDWSAFAGLDSRAAGGGASRGRGGPSGPRHAARARHRRRRAGRPSQRQGPGAASRWDGWCARADRACVGRPFALGDGAATLIGQAPSCAIRIQVDPGRRRGARRALRRGGRVRGHASGRRRDRRGGAASSAATSCPTARRWGSAPACSSSSAPAPATWSSRSPAASPPPPAPPRRRR